MIGSKSRVTASYSTSPFFNFFPARICGAGTPLVKAVVIPPLRSNNSQGLLGTREAPEIQRDQTVCNPKTHGYVTGWGAPQNFHKFQNELRDLRWFQGRNFQTKSHDMFMPCWYLAGAISDRWSLAAQNLEFPGLPAHKTAKCLAKCYLSEAQFWPAMAQTDADIASHCFLIERVLVTIYSKALK